MKHEEKHNYFLSLHCFLCSVSQTNLFKSWFAFISLGWNWDIFSLCNCFFVLILWTIFQYSVQWFIFFLCFSYWGGETFEQRISLDQHCACLLHKHTNTVMYLLTVYIDIYIERTNKRIYHVLYSSYYSPPPQHTLTYFISLHTGTKNRRSVTVSSYYGQVALSSYYGSDKVSLQG